MSYYYINQDSIPFNPMVDGLLGRAMLMKLKEGRIRFADLDSANVEIDTSFEDVKPIILPNERN